MLSESTRERGALLRLDHEHVGVTEFVALVPKWRANAAHRAEVKNRHVIRARRKQRHEGRTMVMTHRVHLRPRLVNFSVDHPLGILPDAGIAQWLRIDVVFNEVFGLYQFGRSRA